MGTLAVELPVSKADRQKAADLAFAGIEKSFGKGSVFVLGRKAGITMPHVATGLFSLDNTVLGIGGLPKGRIIEIYGPECLAADTHIQYLVRTTHRANSKGGTIERLYERFHGILLEGSGQGKYQRASTANAEFSVPSMNECGRIVHNKIVDVVKSGKKECCEVITKSGKRIVASLNHEFCVGDSFIKLKNLKVGSIVFIHNRIPFRLGFSRDYNKGRKYLLVKHHPIAGEKKQGKYSYKRLARARAVVEASMNGLEFSEFVARLNSGRLENLKFLPRTDKVHHKDDNRENDVLENLVVMTDVEHNKHHALVGHNNLRYVAAPDEIASIKSVGIVETYDICMDGPYHNFVANGFVVHNSSGKTTLCLRVVASAQRAGGLCAYVDPENALDPLWAEKNGVDTKNLMVSQPDTGEEALEIVEQLVESGAFAVIVVDSVSALVPKAELEGDFGDSLPGLQARLMSQAMRKLTSKVRKSQVVLVFINQIRERIGVMFGSPETTSGGRALRFFASVRLDVRKIGLLGEKDKPYGNRVKIKSVKNKVGTPYRLTEVDLLYTGDRMGFDVEGDLLESATELGVVEKSGSWYNYKSERLGQGKDNAVKSIIEAGLTDEIYKAMTEKLQKEKEAV